MSVRNQGATCTTSLLNHHYDRDEAQSERNTSLQTHTFDDPELEKLYQSYSIKQRFSDLKCFLYTSILFSLYTVFSSIWYLAIYNKSYFEHLVLIAISAICIAFKIILLSWCTSFKKSWTNHYSKMVPYVAWLMVLFEIFFSFHLRRTTPLYLFEDLGWILVLNYFMYVTLPLSLPCCILLTSCTCVSYLFAIVSLHRFSVNSLQQLAVSGLLLLIVTFLGLVNYFVQDKQKRRAFLETKRSLEVKMVIEEENNEQERLLLSVLPKHVAVQMRQNLGTVDSQFKKIYMSRHENVSILYADIVGFTAISSTYSAQDLVKILNELFARFDRLAEEFHQLRIKILGDCYYCISGAPKERPDHAQLCIHMGLSMVDAIKYVQQKTNSPVDMRVGIHTGAVLAGVLGQRQWQFDVYSKDVELANHMESSGMAGRVHISEKTLNYLNGEFEVEPAYGEKRDEMLRIAGLKTYFIVKVLKPYRSKKLSDKTVSSAKDNSQENELLFHINRGDSIRETIDLDQKQEDFRNMLQRELLYKDNERDIEKYIDPIFIRFTDPLIERAYYRQAGTLSRLALPIFLLVRILINCSHFLYLPRKVINFLSFIILVILFAVTLVSVLSLLKLKSCYGNRKKTWIWTVLNILGILILGIYSLNDVYLCQIDNYSSCKYPAFLSHSNILELILTSQSEVLGFIGKAIAIAIFSLSNSIVIIFVLSDKLDFDDAYVFLTNNQTNRDIINKRLPTKYVLHIMTVTIAISLFFLSRHWEQVSRILFSWRSQVKAQKEQAADMRHKNETLLYNVLPPHVASYFMEKGRYLHYDELYSQSYSEIGVLFASMPNFSDFYSEETVNNQGLECLRFLNEVISDFDALLEKNKFKRHVTKIKTVASTYMVASGLNTDELNKPKESLVKDRWEHLASLVEFAIEMKKALQSINEQSFNHFVLKMGINHGPVTAGVIGARKPHYDIWGNTVNVASRMESTGRAGSIQVTKECSDILTNFGYQFEQRGLVHVKGKGQLMTYYLIEDLNDNFKEVTKHNIVSQKTVKKCN